MEENTMTTRRAALTTALSAIAAVASIGLAGCSKIGDTVKIGVAQPMSGPLAPLGKDMLNGVKLAVDEINKTGLKIDGKAVKLEIVSVDDKANADEGKKVAQTLIDAGVVAVVGHLNSGVSMAAAPMYAEKHIPQLAISTKPEYTKMGLDTTFRLVANDAIQSKAMGSYAASQIAGTAYAVIDDNTPYGKGLADLAAGEIKKQNKAVSVRKSLDDKTVDFAALLPELKAGKVDVIVTTLNDFQVVALIEQLAKAGMTDMRILGGDTIKTDKLVKAPLPIRGVYATSPIIEAREFNAGRDFLARFRQATSGEPIYGAHYAYDAVHVLVAAMKRAESADGEKLTKELKRIDALAPVTNAIRFKTDGEQYYGAISVYKANPGAWEAVMRSDQW
jgi:branched-chain amino acid transport system substrate-binding protein